MDDFTLYDHGSIWLLFPHTLPAQTWASEHLPEDAPMHGSAYAIEARYVEPIATAIVADGLDIGDGR